MSAVARRISTRAPHRGVGAAAGFTLIELMVVLVIIALLAAAVMLTMADPRGGLSGEVDRLAGRIRAARDSAIVSGHSVALWVSPTGYGFERRDDGRWQPIVDGPLAATDWARGAQAVIASGNRLRVTWKTGPAFVRGWSIRVSGAQQGRRKGAVTLLRSAGDDHSVDFANVPKGELRVSVIGRRYQGTVTRKDVKYLAGRTIAQ